MAPCKVTLTSKLERAPVNKAVVARVAKTNAAYQALTPEVQAAIRESLFVTGGYAVRTTSDGVYSNHSVGYAIDVNEHQSTKQNHHFQNMDSIDGKMLSRAIKAQKDSDKKTQLQLIQSNWSALRAWLFGVTVRDEREEKDKRIVGMIPLHEEALKMFLDTGWVWGGNWKDEKDYMHFEDPDALKHVTLAKGKTTP